MACPEASTTRKPRCYPATRPGPAGKPPKAPAGCTVGRLRAPQPLVTERVPEAPGNRRRPDPGRPGIGHPPRRRAAGARGSRPARDARRGDGAPPRGAAQAQAPLRSIAPHARSAHAARSPIGRDRQGRTVSGSATGSPAAIPDGSGTREPTYPALPGAAIGIGHGEAPSVGLAERRDDARALPTGDENARMTLPTSFEIERRC
jgi:hypothetical protein